MRPQVLADTVTAACERTSRRRPCGNALASRSPRHQEIISTCCCQRLRFGAFCSAAVDDKHTRPFLCGQKAVRPPALGSCTPMSPMAPGAPQRLGAWARLSAQCLAWITAALPRVDPPTLSEKPSEVVCEQGTPPRGGTRTRSPTWGVCRFLWCNHCSEPMPSSCESLNEALGRDAQPAASCHSGPEPTQPARTPARWDHRACTRQRYF